MEKIRYTIGIDPGEETGVAVYDRKEKRIVQVYTSNFWELYTTAKNVWKNDFDDAILVIETPKRTGLYERYNVKQGPALREKIASDAGSNAREADLLATGLERLGFTVRRVKPTNSKWDAKKLKMVTGIEHRTNQHVRDAIQLCWGI
jgi:hypothetical protein